MVADTEEYPIEAFLKASAAIQRQYSLRVIIRKWNASELGNPLGKKQ